MPTPIVIKYWPILARGAGLFRMCVEKDVPFDHQTDMAGFGAALFGADSANLAPPILIDGDLTISQSSACHMYLGKKLGFTAGINTLEDEARALQYMGDLSDLHADCQEAAIAGKASKDVAALQAYLTGDRYKSTLRAIEKCVKGPYYFGSEPSYMDFYADCYLCMLEGKWLGPLIPKSGDTIEMYAPKLKAAVAGVRALPSAAKMPKLPPVPSSLTLTAERVATWQAVALE